MPEKCTNASFPPSSGVMNPKPFSSLNHFTTPVAIQHLLTLYLYARGGAAGHCLPACSTARRAGQRGVYTRRRGGGRDQPGACAPPPGESLAGPSAAGGARGGGPRGVRVELLLCPPPALFAAARVGGG